MSLFKKLMILSLLIMVAAAAGGGIFLHSVKTRAVPEYRGRLDIPGLNGEVTVYRDSYAVPHITAEDEDDLYFAVGYTLAQDRLWQMDLLRRVTLGRLSEIFGADLVTVDLSMRALRIPDKSRLILSKTDPKIMAALQRFSDGVNHLIRTRRNRLPPEFFILGYAPDLWKPEHSLNLVGYMAWDLTLPNTIEPLLHKISKKVDEARFRELLPDVLSQTPSVYGAYTRPGRKFLLASTLADRHRILEEYGLTIFHGSNNWAVSGEKSTTGRPIFANDMHLGLNAPGLWYQMHQTVRGKVNVTGVVLPGQPFVISGHNDRIAWGMTNVMVDDMDFYRERPNPDNPGEYEFNGGFRPFTERWETVKIKGGEDVVRRIRFTHRGPVISEFKGLGDEIISMRWLGNDFSDELRSVYLLNRAGNWEDFKEAVRSFRAVSQNINYADVDGNIGLYCSAGIPVRKKGDGISVHPGWTDEYDWKGVVPFEELPHEFNPASGFVSSANNKTAPDAYPYYVSHWYALNYRIDRIRELLSQKEKLTIEDFKAMHGDFKSKLAEEFTPFLLARLSPSGGHTPLERKALSMLRSWDGVMDKESGAAALFELTYIRMVKALLRDDLGPELYKEYAANSMLHRFLTKNIVRSGASAFSDRLDTGDKTETLDDIVRASFKEAVADLSGRLGSDPGQWAWGKIHQLELRHPLGRVKLLDRTFGFNDRPRPMGGSFHTVCPLAYRLSDPFAINHGASHRHIYHTGNWDDSLSVIPTGISGIPASDHYCDQTGLYAANQYHPDPFSNEAVRKAQRYTLVLTPSREN